MRGHRIGAMQRSNRAEAGELSAKPKLGMGAAIRFVSSATRGLQLLPVATLRNYQGGIFSVAGTEQI